MWLIILSASVSAEEVTNKQFSGNLESGFSNMYLGKVGVAVKEEPQLQSQLSLRYGDEKSAWYGSIWTTNSLRNRKGFSDEIDLSVGYQRYFEKTTVDTRISYFAFNDLAEPKTDQWAIELKLTLDKTPVAKPYLHLRYFGEVGNKSPDKGFFAFVGATRSQRLGFNLPWTDKEQSLDLGAETLWSFGALGRDAGYVGTKFWTSTTIPTSKRSYFTPSIAYQLSAGDQNGGLNDYVDGNKWVFRLAWGFNF